ncbi:hypothetical protein AB0K81_00980 [Streptomyces werraensis]|uniref:Uncharacterized protein n=1 Tax=Streptomyces werraensis TaxID=68284 RepID=A0ABV3J744_9ACTN
MREQAPRPSHLFTRVCAVSAFGVLTAGELRRADVRSGSVDAAT